MILEQPTKLSLLQSSQILSMLQRLLSYELLILIQMEALFSRVCYLQPRESSRTRNGSPLLFYRVTAHVSDILEYACDIPDKKQ